MMENSDVTTNKTESIDIKTEMEEFDQPESYYDMAQCLSDLEPFQTSIIKSDDLSDTSIFENIKTESDRGMELQPLVSALVLDADDEDPDNVSVAGDNTDSEVSGNSDDENSAPLGPQYLGKDNTPWNIHPPRQQRRRAQGNILREQPGVRGAARDAKTVVETWKIFFPDSVLQTITTYTNCRLNLLRENYANERDCKETNFDEISAVFGLLYLAGVLKSSHQSVEDLWATDGTAPPLFRLIMPIKRFLLLLGAMRFDDSSTRDERRQLDKLAPVREIFEDFVQRCMQSYKVGECVTIDEMLESFRGRCPFRQYMPRKPAKYGIKLFALVDSGVFYTSKLEVYCGAQPNGPYSVDNRPTAVVNRLVDHIQGTGRNVTMDNWFSSVSLVNELSQQKNLTVVATLKKNKREVPPQLVNTRAMPINSSMFAFGENCMLLSYIPKKYRNVLMISSMHDTDMIDETSGKRQKPVLLTYYNKTKGSVAVVDRLKADYTVARINSRWPMRLLYTMLDIGILNAEIIHYVNTTESFTRKSFQKTLAIDLVRNHMITRSALRTLRMDLRLDIRRYLKLPPQQNPESDALVKCGFCPKKKNRKTQHHCEDCNVPVCGEHTAKRESRCHDCEASRVAQRDE